MRKKLAALLMATTVLVNILGIGSAAAQKSGMVQLTARREGQKILVTVTAKEMVFNALQLKLAYDAERLTPSKFEDNSATDTGKDMTRYLVDTFDPFSENGGGWRAEESRATLHYGAVEHLLMADPASAGIATDESGYVVAGAGVELFSMSFRLAEGAELYSDSIRLCAGEGIPSGVAISVKDNVQGVTNAECVTIDLSGVAKGEKTPAGSGDFGTGAPPATEDGGQNGGNSGGGGATGDKTPDAGEQGKPNTPVMSDIAGNWAERFIKELLAKGVVSGYPDGTFRPGENLAREEVAIVLCRMMELKPAERESSFSDCGGRWAEGYIQAAYEAGYMNGVGGGRFEPERPISKQEMITILARALKLPATKQAQFTDGDQIAPWAATAVSAAVEAGLVTGRPDGSLHPQDSITRGEMAKLIAEAMAR